MIQLAESLPSAARLPKSGAQTVADGAVDKDPGAATDFGELLAEGLMHAVNRTPDHPPAAETGNALPESGKSLPQAEDLAGQHPATGLPADPTPPPHEGPVAGTLSPAPPPATISGTTPATGHDGKTPGADGTAETAAARDAPSTKAALLARTAEPLLSALREVVARMARPDAALPASASASRATDAAASGIPSAHTLAITALAPAGAAGAAGAALPALPTAPQAPGPTTPQAQEMPRHDLSTLVDRLTQAREAGARGEGALVVRNADFGQISLRFHQHEGMLSVTVANTDPDFIRAVVAATAGGMAQDRHAGLADQSQKPDQHQNQTHSGGQTPGQGQDQKPTHLLPTGRPQAAQQAEAQDTPPPPAETAAAPTRRGTYA